MNNYKLDDIIAYNRMTNPDLLLPGEVILFPEESFNADSGSIKIMKYFSWNESVYVTGLARVFVCSCKPKFRIKKVLSVVAQKTTVE